ncbi:hypothetical protein [Mesorhizobium sp. M7A.F.Ca.CA.004.04.2.1]|nr:hypothetical protein [Mesorhizobium sp. M7A.F.Ca.CA.004.04.2.1]
MLFIAFAACFDRTPGTSAAGASGSFWAAAAASRFVALEAALGD